ncbi:MAG: hypothetical protein WCC94_04195 [Candidatus Bathyarchaeia archaeon]
MPAQIMEQQLDADILKALSSESLGYRELMDKCRAADRPLRRRLEWLVKHRYVSRPSRNWKQGRKIRHSITKRGVSYYQKIRDVASIQRVAVKLKDWLIMHDDERATELLLELFASLFRLTHKRFHEARDPRILDVFMSRAEIVIQDYLNEKLADEERGNMDASLRWPYFEFYMVTIPRPSEALREDGKLAYECGHGLTECHVDLLCDQLKLFKKEALLLRNQNWLERRKGLDVCEELQKEFLERRMKLEQMYPAAFGTEFGLDHPGKRGIELA